MAGKALIRADGSKDIGMGHLKRACLLSDMLRRYFALETKLIFMEDRLAETFISQEDIQKVILPKSISDEEEKRALQQIIKTESPSLFILDVLEKDLDSAYIGAIRKFGCPLVAITDDSNRRIIDADIIVNGNPLQREQDYSGEAGRYLLGPMYFLMDSAYSHSEVKEPEGDVKKILLTFGGSDHNDLLLRVLKIIDNVRPDLGVLVLTSKASGYLDRLKKHLDCLKLSSEIFVDVDSLAPYWGKCDMAITSAGNTLFERISVRMPGATLCQLVRQMEIADRFEYLGVNTNLGFGPDISDDALAERISTFINNREEHSMQHKKAPEIIDGKGSERFKTELNTLLKGALQ